ncbi:MAG: RagB/SusD family nutrient uptake outer membrane protein [Prevotellaceae bacterium]|jgi:hypothetical protein|nr:RagB/SusD family nutrient uptake outer membrane protein [Prevotellaceae bacterium]
MKKTNILIAVVLVFFMSSCSNEWLNTAPATSLSSLDAVECYNDVYSLSIGMYHGLRGTSGDPDRRYYGADFIFYGDVRGDDMQARTAGMRTSLLYEMSYTALNVPNLWQKPYDVIHRANEVIFSIEDGKADDGVKANIDDLLGQALTVRALAHFDLVRVFGKPYTMSGGPASFGVPIMNEPHPASYLPSRNSVEEVYAAVISDLTRAIPLLKSAKSNGFINSWAAKSLLARVYLYKADYNNAYSTAVDVINNGGYALWEANEYVNAWKSPYGKEMIFELIIQSVDAWTDREGIAYLMSEEGYADFILTKTFVDLMNRSENTGDVRKDLMGVPTLSTFTTEKFWGQPVFLKKLPGQSASDLRLNNIPIFRLSEQYLIAAEAALKKSSPDQTAANNYLNAIVSRRNPSRGTVTATEATVLTEKRMELIGEGHGFFDAMRLGNTISRPDDGWHVPLITDSKTFDRSYYRAILAIPSAEMNANSSIREQQNPGY